MKEALVKGETHLSKRDKQALMEMDFSQFDAVFREGHDTDYYQRDLDSLYALFAIGHLVYGATYGRLYFSSDNIEEKSEEEAVPFYGEIDASIYETYEMVPRWKRVGLLLLSPVMAGFLLGLLFSPLQWTVNRFAIQLSPLFGVIAAIGMILFFGFLWALAYFMLIEDEVMYDRDDEMTEEILQIVEKEGYSSILVSCGGNHRPGIASSLRDEGWEVEERTTDSPIGKVLLWKDRLVSAVLNPRDTLTRFRNFFSNR